MKRKTAFILSAVMAFNMLFVNAMAASNNSIDRVDVVKYNEVIQNVNLKIEPKDAIEYDDNNPSGTSIIIDIENGEFNINHRNDWGEYDLEIPEYIGPYGETYAWITNEIYANVYPGMSQDEKDQAIIDCYYHIKLAGRSDLPWHIVRISDTRLQVYLAPLPASAADKAGDFFNEKPYYLIPIKAVAAYPTGDINIKIDANGTSVSATAHKVAELPDTERATFTKVDKVNFGNKYVDIAKLTVTEFDKAVFVPEKEIKISVNDGFEIVDEENISVSAGDNLKNDGTHPSVVKQGDNSIVFSIPAAWMPEEATENTASFTVEGIRVKPDEKSVINSDVFVTISGNDAGISEQTIKAGTRAYGLEIKDNTVISADPDITSVNIPNGVTAIGEAAFSGCKKLTYIGIPADVTYIAPTAFEGCDLNAVFTEEGSYAEQWAKGNSRWCYIGENPAYPVDGGNIYIYDNVVKGADTKIKSADIPNTVTVIENYAFAHCKKLTSVTFPESITTIGDAAFEECTSLTDIELPAGINVINAATFYGCKALKSADIPAGVTKIDIRAFSGCSGMEKISLPESVTEIHSIAFENCDKEKLVFYVAENSYAEQWAKDNGFKYVTSGGYAYGDADGDKVITASDAALVLQKALTESTELPLQKNTDDWLKYADVDGDNNITASDAALILQKTLSEKISFPAVN